jgi:hypothetical protein
MEPNSSLVGQSMWSEVKCCPKKPLPVGYLHVLLLCPSPCSVEHGNFDNSIGQGLPLQALVPWTALTALD